MVRIPPEKKGEIARQWLEAAIQDYPASTARHLLYEKDRFRNPVGTTLKEGIPRVVEELIEGADPDTLKAELEGIVRIRSVQGLSPGQALSFIFKLKAILREESSIGPEDAIELEHRIDEMALAAFDLYAHCREQVYEVRLNEVRRREGVLENMFARDEGE